MIYHSKRNSRSAESVAKFWGKSLSSRKWFDMSQDDNGSAVIRINDVIGWPWITADDFLRELDTIDASDITVKINSPGGDVFDGTAIYNGIKDHPANVTTIVEGLAASMGSVIALAGDEVIISDSGYFMIHQPWTIMGGDYRDFEKEAELLKRIGLNLGKIYSDKTGKKSGEISSLMDEESWFMGSEAVNAGFADKTTSESEKVNANFDAGIYMHTPTDLKNEIKSDKNILSERELERMLTRDAGLSRAAAKTLLSRGYASVVKPGADTDMELIASIEALSNKLKN